MQADFAEVGTADFSEICLLVSVAGEARAKISAALANAHGGFQPDQSEHGDDKTDDNHQDAIFRAVVNGFGLLEKPVDPIHQISAFPVLPAARPKSSMTSALMRASIPSVDVLNSLTV